MKYENYQRKIQRLSAVLKWIKSHRILIVVICSLFFTALCTMLSFKGTMIASGSVAPQVVYGQSINYKAKAILSNVEYQYCTDGLDDWSLAEPKNAGTYQVRAVSKRLFGTANYSKPQTFQIIPRQLEVSIGESKVVYGQNPSLSGNLAYEDTIACTLFIYDDIGAKSTLALPKKEAITIKDKLGNDVTSSYSISVFKGEVTFSKRELTIETLSAAKVYDDIALTKNEYKISKGSLAYADALTANYTGGQVDAGQSKNTAEFKIKAQNGTDVTAHYEITSIFGDLTVEKRPVKVASASASRIYNNTPLTNLDFSLDSATPLAAGHNILAVGATVITNVSTVQNRLEYKVLSGQTDVTKNYEFNHTFGTLTVLPFSVTVNTLNGSAEYNGSPQCYAEFEALHLFEGHQAQFKQGSALGTAYVGTSQNIFEVEIFDSYLENISGNYQINYNYGTLNVVRRNISVTTISATFYYNGEYQSNGQATALGLVSGHTLSAKNLVALKDVDGILHKNIFDVEIYFGNENVTENYNIAYNYGTVQMLPRLLTLSTFSDDFTYNGQGQFNLGFSLSPALKAGHTAVLIDGLRTILTVVEPNAQGKPTPVDNVLGVKIMQGNEDVSFNYTIIYNYGKVVMHPRKLTIATNYNTWEYDGNPHFDEGHAITLGSLVEGQHTKVIFSTKLTDAGSSHNVAQIAVFSGQIDVSINYEIDYVFGIISVSPREITIATASDSWAYNGRAHYNLDCTADRLVEGHQLYVVKYSFITDAGSKQNNLEVAVYGIDGYVTENYAIKYEFGTLTVTKRVIEIITTSSTWVYDGQEHSDEGYAVSGGSLVEGHVGNIISLTKIVNAGSCENKLTLSIFSANENVSANYQISYVYGTLTITCKPITVGLYNDGKYYDGTPLTANDFYVFSPLGGIVEGQYAVCSSNGTQTQIGSSENIITSFRIYWAGTDTTSNYLITFLNGTLTVYARSITVQPNSANKIFDGTPLTDSGYTILGAGLLNGHYLSAQVLGQQTQVGISDNIVVEGSVKIVNAFGVDVSSLYNVHIGVGKLHIGLIRVTVVSANAQKDYDGTPLSAPEYHVIGQVPNGHTHQAVYFTQAIYPGEYVNRISLEFFNNQGENVTDNYLIVNAFGTLIVRGSLGDGTLGGGLGSSQGTPPSTDAVFNATSTASGITYFRMKSFGDYNFNSWLNAPDYNLDTINAMYLTASALQDKGHSISSVEIEPLISYLAYTMPYYAVNGYTTTSDTIAGDATNGRYSVDYITYALSLGDDLSVPYKYKDYENSYYNHVLSTYLSLPSTTKTKLLEIALSIGLNAFSPTIVQDVANYVQNLVAYNYNHEAYQGDYALYFFTQAKTAVCRHYATAATAMFRALGIPARYTVGYAGNMLSNETVKITTAQAHAWVEVYIKGTGWVQVEVTGAGEGNPVNDGETTDESIVLNKENTLYIKPIDVVKQYDGTALFAQNIVEGDNLDSSILLQSLLDAGYYYVASVTGQRTEYGVSKSSIVSFVLYNSYGINVSQNYEIIYAVGRVRIINTPIYVNLFNVSKSYDGTPLCYNPDDYWVDLPNNITLEFSLEGSLTNSGQLKLSSFESLPYRVFNNGLDVTHMYSLVFLGKPLTINRRLIELTTGSAKKTYDYTPLTNNEVWISKGAFPAGHFFNAVLSGSITDIGQTHNTISLLKIFDSLNQDVTKNFTVKAVFGTLSVTS